MSVDTVDKKLPTDIEASDSVGDLGSSDEDRAENQDKLSEMEEVSVSKEELAKVAEILDENTEKDIHYLDTFGAAKKISTLVEKDGMPEFKLLFILALLSDKYQTADLVNFFSNGALPRSLVNVAKEIMWRPDVDESFKAAFTSMMRYNHTFDKTSTQKLLQTIDFSRSSEVFKASAWLDFLRRLYSGANFNTAQQRNIDIRKGLLQKYKESEDDTIYFLDLQIKDLLQQMDAGLAELDLRRDKYPFKVSGNLYGIHKNGKLYVADPKNNKKILDIINQVKLFQDQYRGLPDGTPINIKPLRMLYSEMMSMFDKSIDIQRPTGISKEEWKREYFNYSCLMRKPIREVIEKDFGFSLEELSVKEQFYFLNYAKHYSVKDVKRLQEFIKQYGVQGARTFLSLEYGRLEMGDVILKIGEQLRYNPEIANRVFGQYLEMVDGVENEVNDLVKMYNNIFFDKQIDEDKARQAMLKKANLILQKSLKRLEGASDDKKADIIDKLIADLKRQVEVEKQSLEYLRSLSKRLNYLYNQIGNQIIGEDLVKELHRVRENNFGDIDEKYLKKIDDDYARHQKYDSKRIKGDIEFLKTMYTLSAEQEMAIRSLPDVTDDMIARIHVNNEKDRMEYESQVAKLEKLLKLQEELEGALEEYIYDQKVEPDDIDNPDVSSRVMKRYQELVEEAKKNREELRLLFGDEVKLTEEDLNRISNNILKEAKQVLDDYVERAINDKVGVDEQEALSVLEGASVKINVLSSILKLVKEKGNYSGGLEVVKNLDIEFKDLGSDFDEDGEKSKMIKNLIIRQAIIGRQKEGESIQQVEKQAGVMDTKEALENVKNIRTYILK